MSEKKFKNVATVEGSTKWDQAIKRDGFLPKRDNDIRSEFARDYNRILHSTAYRRLKHKTQVFFAPENDHICTRIEHVNHVSSISATISEYLGLNTELATAIAIGHDLGHTPFGHAGEEIISRILKEKTGKSFWHEQNSLRFVDEIETLEDPYRNHINLLLTYGVRDGIVCHSGEVDENQLKPRESIVDLKGIIKANEYYPYTWEGCVVKISDKIAYLGRDIEDALSMRILEVSEIKELVKIVRKAGREKIREINNTVLIHDFIIDICENSNPDEGIVLSEENLKIMNLVKKFNYQRIYNHQRLAVYKGYAELIIKSLFEILIESYSSEYKKLDRNIERIKKYYPILGGEFAVWVKKYGCRQDFFERNRYYKNKCIYDLSSEKDYAFAVIDFISGMTDNFAIKSFKEITVFV